MVGNDEDGDERHLVLTGPMGSGKTTVGVICARRLGRPLIDSDDQIEERWGISGRELVAREGVERLHAEEARALREAVATAPRAVVAAAASIGDAPDLVSLLADIGAFAVLLVGDEGVLEARARAGGHRRLLDPDDARLQTANRHRRLERVVALVVDVTEIAPEEVADRILAAMAPR